jgi:hypothetical protein
MLKSLHCQGKYFNKNFYRTKKKFYSFPLAFPYQLWNNFAFQPPSSTRRFNIPPPPPPPTLPISSFHSTTAGALPYPGAACMHPAFNYPFNRPETMTKPSLINHRTNYFNPHQQQSTRNREISASSSSSTSSSYCPDVTSGLSKFLSLFIKEKH